MTIKSMCDYEKLLKSEIAGHLFAGLWFAVAAVIPVVFYFLAFSLSGDTTFQFSVAAVSIVTAGICGFAIGADILVADETKSVFPAIGRGVAIAFLSYWILFVIGFISTAFYSRDFFGLILSFVVMFLYGLIFIGWLVAIVGGAAGGLLYLFRLKTMKRFDVGGEL